MPAGDPEGRLGRLGRLGRDQVKRRVSRSKGRCNGEVYSAGIGFQEHTSMQGQARKQAQGQARAGM